MSEWYPIDTYPREKIQFGGSPEDTCDWGPDALLLVPATEAYPAPFVVVGHLEADEWLARDPADPDAFGGLVAEPTHWAAVPAYPEP